MILRRLADGIRTQDWFTVVVEVLIVVVGIFLGLQVDGWNQAREERLEEQIYLERLQADFAAHKAKLLDSIELAGVRFQQIEMVEAAIRSPSVAAENPDRFITAVEKTAWASYLTPGPNTYGELLSTGRMTLLRSRELRDLLVAFYGEVDRWEPILNFADARGTWMRGTVGLVSREYLTVIESKSEEAEWPVNIIGATPAEATAIAEGLAERTDVVKWLPRIYQYHVLAEMVMQGHLERADAVITEIESQLGNAAKSEATVP